MTESKFDFILAGGGCAGLSLAHHLSSRPELSQKRILIIDKDSKTQNDRTWCFWEKNPGPFESIVHREWEKAWFYGPNWSKLLDLKPYSYKMIRSERFYNFVKTELKRHPNITIIQTEIQEITSTNELASVKTSAGDFFADWVFSSLVSPVEKLPGHHYLLQHFLGWHLTADKPIFNPGEPVLMDFQIDQGGDCRFMYVLPEDENRALVEYTLFSEKTLENEEYKIALNNYLEKKFPSVHFKIDQEEFGIIPMYSAPFDSDLGARVIQIGTAGGQTKASTGYTFSRIQRHSIEIANCLERGNNPKTQPATGSRRFIWFDNVLLHVLANKIESGALIFQNLFKKNRAETVLQFLDEDSHFLQEFQIMNSVPVFKFIGPGWKELLRMTIRK